MAEKILIIGKGFLGGYIFDQSSLMGLSPVTTNHDAVNFDIRDINLVEKVISYHKPDFIVNCAALTNIDQIEANPTEAYQVNGDGAKNVAMVANKEKIKLIHVSTDSVFDGKKGMYNENDLLFPINEYAKSKKIGEDHVKKICERYVIVRTNFYGYNKQGKHLFNWILTSLKNARSIIGFYDVFFNPLEVENLSMMIIELGLNQYDGVIHLASDEIMNKYQYALKIAEILNFDKSLITKGSISDSNLLAKRPLNTTLSNAVSKKILKTPFVSLDDWLRHNCVDFCSLDSTK